MAKVAKGSNGLRRRTRKKKQPTAEKPETETETTPPQEAAPVVSEERNFVSPAPAERGFLVKHVGAFFEGLFGDWDHLESDSWYVLLRISVALILWEEGVRMARATLTSASSKLLTKYVDSRMLVPHAIAEGWLPPLPGAEGLELLHGLQAAAAFLILVGLFTRASALLALVIRAWLFLANEAFYLNHHYAEILLVLPVLAIGSTSLSLDALLEGTPFWAPHALSRWWRWPAVFVLDCIYCFGALSKTKYDWLRASNVGRWFSGRKLLRNLGWYSEAAEQWLTPKLFFSNAILHWSKRYWLAYGGLFWDAAAPILNRGHWMGGAFGWALLVVGVLGTFAFHSLNHLCMNIGVFPLFSILATASLYWIRPASVVTIRKTLLPEDQQNPDDAGRVRRHTWRFLPMRKRRLSGGERAAMVFAVLFAVSMVALPMRSEWRGDDKAYDSTSQYFSWGMKLNSRTVEVELGLELRNATTGEPLEESLRPFKLDVTPLIDVELTFVRAPPDDSDHEHGELLRVTIDGEPLLSGKAAKRIISRPNAFCRISRKAAQIYGNTICPQTYGEACDVGVFVVYSSIEVDGRRRQRFYKPDVDLTALADCDWPTETMLEKREPAEEWIRYDLPWAAAAEHFFGDSNSPCLPWNRVLGDDLHDRAGLGSSEERKEARNRVKEAVEASEMLCAHYWYSEEGGRRQQLRGSADGKTPPTASYVEAFIDRFLVSSGPSREGYNGAESCEEALGRRLGSDAMASILCSTPPFTTDQVPSQTDPGQEQPQQTPPQ